MFEKDRMALAEIHAKLTAMANALGNSENPYFDFGKFKNDLAGQALALDRIVKAHEAKEQAVEDTPTSYPGER